MPRDTHMRVASSLEVLLRNKRAKTATGLLNCGLAQVPTTLVRATYFCGVPTPISSTCCFPFDKGCWRPDKDQGRRDSSPQGKNPPPGTAPPDASQRLPRAARLAAGGGCGKPHAAQRAREARELLAMESPPRGLAQQIAPSEP